MWLVHLHLVGLNPKTTNCVFILVIPFLKNGFALQVFVKCNLICHKLTVCATKKRHLQLEMVLDISSTGLTQLKQKKVKFDLKSRHFSVLPLKNQGINGMNDIKAFTGIQEYEATVFATNIPSLPNQGIKESTV